ncbi:MAG: histidinol dehydrogenase [Deltaproteobacteria bacterium]|nr:histidinol dehydrogenase [Deltaproteobacteria bacterium]
MSMRILSSSDPSFATHFSRLALRAQADSSSARAIEDSVRSIIDAVREKRDAALVELSRRFDERPEMTEAAIEVPAERLRTSVGKVSQATREALARAHARIERFHRAQAQDIKTTRVVYEGIDAQLLARPLERVGLYVPGGRAQYPSTVLMNATPARVAGVKELVVVTPARKGEVSDLVLAAAQIAGVDRVFSVGGAQAIAALAYGTETIPKVDKIVGPGNAYVAEAKRQVFGHVAIDQIAGPSEVVILVDASANPDWVAADLLAQAEHDPRAAAVAITWDPNMAVAIQRAIDDALVTLPTATVAGASIRDHGAIVLAPDVNVAVELANRYAPEHLGLAVSDASSYVSRIQHAGAVFVGHHTSEALGDYNAGVNHVLPTSGSARFSSPLSVHDFIKRMSVLEVNEDSFSLLAEDAAHLAREEGLEGHARALEARLKPTPKDDSK